MWEFQTSGNSSKIAFQPIFYNIQLNNELQLNDTNPLILLSPSNLSSVMKCGKYQWMGMSLLKETANRIIIISAVLDVL